jgi:transposase
MHSSLLMVLRSERILRQGSGLFAFRRYPDKFWHSGRGPERHAHVLGRAVPNRSLPRMTELFAPALRANPMRRLPNWTILPVTKVAGVKEAIERPGATLRYLPAYSPDLNPIEQAFAKLKAAIRKAAARTFDAFIQAIASALASFTPQECANYLANSGYGRQS